VDLHLGENLTEQGKPPLALEAFEEGGPEDFGVVAVREMLKEIPAALKQAQATTDADFKPKLVREGGQFRRDRERSRNRQRGLKNSTPTMDLQGGVWGMIFFKSNRSPGKL
jgi:hypothetical protein